MVPSHRQKVEHNPAQLSGVGAGAGAGLEDPVPVMSFKLLGNTDLKELITDIKMETLISSRESHGAIN